jgi:hypothetical protein
VCQVFDGSSLVSDQNHLLCVAADCRCCKEDQCNQTVLERSPIAYPANEGQSQTRQSEVVDVGPPT